ncbi:MAG: hypothetical protein WCA77_04310, partial [Thermoplasmata archaeon]
GAGRPYHDALDVAVETASVVVEACWDADLRTGLLLFADGPRRYVPPGRGPDHQFTLTRALTTAQLDPAPFQLDAALAYLLGRLTRSTNILGFTALGGDIGRSAEVIGWLRAKGTRAYLFTPDSSQMYPPLPRPLDERILRAVLDPEARRADRDLARVRQAGIPVATYGREGALDQVGFLLSRFGAGRAAY